MALELVYTSAPRGLRLGSSGFCTVACTRGMGPNYVELLESLSGYAPVYPVHDARARRNPVAHSHYRFQVGGKPVSVLSRVAFAGADYSNRSNKFAHHVVLDMAERPPGGPAWLMRREGFMLERWGDEPGYIDRPRKVPQGDAQPAPCDFWERAAGDPGWAGALAEAFLDAPSRPSFVVFDPGAPMLELVDEALRLLPAERRWDVTFNTYFVTLPVGTSCLWRCCLQGAEALKQARRTPGTVLIDLTPGGQSSEAAQRILAEGSPLVEAARTGRLPREAVPAASDAQQASPAEDRREAASRAQGPLRLRDEAPPRQPPQAPPPLRVPQPKRRAPWSVLAALLALLAVCGLLGFLYRSERGQRLDLQARIHEKGQEIEELEGQLEKERSEKDSHSQRVNELKEENERLKKEKEIALAQAAERSGAPEDEPAPDDFAAQEPEEPEGGEDVAAQEEPALRAVAAIGRLRDASRTLASGQHRDVPADGVDASWRKMEAGWWGEEGPPEGVRLRLTEEERLELSLPHLVERGKWVPCVSIYPSDGAVRFEPAEGVSQKQLAQAGLDRLGWLRLASDSERLALVLNCLPEGEVEMTGGVVPNDEEHYKARGSLSLPSPLADAASSPKVRWSPASGDEAKLDHEWVGGRLEITAVLPGVNSDDAAREKLANKKLEIRLDGQKIGSYKLKLAE